MYGLSTKREVKKAETKSRSIYTQKKERGQYPAILTEQAWSIKDLLYGQNFGKPAFASDKFSLLDKARIPSGQDSSILPARVAKYSTRFGSPCPPTGLGI